MPINLTNLQPAALLPFLLAAGSAFAGVTITLAPAPNPLRPGQAYRIQPEITGAGDDRHCWWAITEAEENRLVGPWDGVQLVARPDGCAILSVQGGDAPRRLLLRVTSRQDPSAFAVVPLEVAVLDSPLEAGAVALPEGCAGWAPVPAPALEAAPPPEPEPHVWATGFRRQLTAADVRRIWPGAKERLEPVCDAYVWDPVGPGPAILALCRSNPQAIAADAALVRIALDGGMAVLATTDPEAAGPAGPWCHERPVGPCALAVRRGGAVVVSDELNDLIWQVERNGRTTILAGDPGEDAAPVAGKPGLAGAPDPDAGYPPALGTPLPDPIGVTVTRADEVVFTTLGDYGAPGSRQVTRITAAGRLVPLAGGASEELSCSEGNDLTRSQPATACILARPAEVVTAPGGRILVLDQCTMAILELRPDGTMQAVEGVRPHHGERRSDIFRCSDTLGGMAPWGASGVCFGQDNLLLAVGPQGAATLVGTLQDRGGAREGQGSRRQNGIAPMAGPVLPGSQARFTRFTRMAAAPGGGVLVQAQPGDRLYFVDAGRGSATLAAKVDEAAAAAARGDRDRLEAIRRALRAWAQGPRATYQACVLRPGFGKTLSPITADPLGVVGDCLQDFQGLALRAQLALDAITARIQMDGEAAAAGETKLSATAEPIR